LAAGSIIITPSAFARQAAVGSDGLFDVTGDLQL